MPEGTFELVSHPGYRDEQLARANTRLLESREIERNALMAIRDYRGIDLISFGALGQPADRNSLDKTIAITGFASSPGTETSNQSGDISEP
jgi:hypothetical protein